MMQQAADRTALAPWAVRQAAPVAPRRQQRGRIAAMTGLMAEDNVQRVLQRRGATILTSRWRGKAGEIDLIVRDGEDLVFVEVKAAATHADAALRLQRPQMRRIMQAALEYCDACGLAQVPMRFDVALVDAAGRVDLIENAFQDC